MTIGVRPHAVAVAEGGFPAEVVANQWLGDQTHIAANFAGGTIVSVAHDRVRHAAGARIGIRIAPRDLHIFDTETGRALHHGGDSV